MMIPNQKRHVLARCASFGGASALLLLSATARAQTAPPADASNGAVLEQIVVTADRQSYSADFVQAGSFRGARQIDTPLTISVIPQEVLQAQQAKGLLDALKNTAGVTSSQTSPTVYNNLSIRGIPVDNRGNYRLDGSLPIVNLIDLPLEDKDRVEALKGASALYYGFTTPSGIINLTMKRPTHTAFVDSDTFGDDNGGVGEHIDANDWWGIFGARVNAVYAKVDSGIDLTEGQRALVAGAFDIRPTDKLVIQVDLEHIEKTVPEPTVYLLVAPKPTAANLYPQVSLPPLLNPRTNLGAEWMKNQAKEDNALIHGNYNMSQSWALTFDTGASIASRSRRFSTFTPTNLVTGDGTLKTTLQNDNQYKNFEGRVELAGAFDTGPIDHELLVGVSKNVRRQFNSTSTGGVCPGPTAGSKPVTCTQNMFDPVPIPYSALPAPVGVITQIDDVGYYVFEHAKYQDWLHVLAGVRKSDYTESNITTNTDTFHATPTPISYGVVLKPKSWLSFYGTYIEGLESTAAAPVTSANAGVVLPAATSKQTEGGVKIEPLRGLLFQAAYFNIERASTYVNASNVYVEDGRARYRGTELSLTGEITPQLSIYASGLILDAKQISGAATAISGTTVVPTAVGKEIDNTPKQTWSISGEYRFASMAPGLSVTAGAYYIGPRAVNNLDQAYVPGYTLFDAGFAYEKDLWSRPWTFRLYADNLANKRYWASTSTLFLAEGPPSVVKLSLQTRF
ncbi:MAG TPA: TonB-dependent siderophore receptor [Steroidobacteraceae bacterium]|jgi:iron complex outermembrane receptor protein|nr:TonB-dependent siderophore receptor [Steroidobacteraceae bacterium]